MTSKTTSSEKFPFLAGGGEMGELMRSKDWSQSLAGTPDTWPQSLRTTLSILLNSKFPMFLFWGSDLICFYNDAYRPSLGETGKHPDILGSRGEDYWKEIWPVIKPLIDQILSGGEATWSQDQLIPIFRNDKMEDVYWTFSYSPVNDESGLAAGVFVTCNETTEQVITRLKLEESKDMLEFAIDAAQLGTWDYNPFTNKFISNDRLKEWFGLPAEQEIELHQAIDAIAEKDQQRIIEAITKVLDFSSGGSYQEEYIIIHPVTKKEKIVHARGRAWFNNEKIAYRFNGTLEDVTEQTLARKKMEESDQRFRAAVQAVKGILWTNNAEGKMEGEQPAWAALTGQSYEEYQGYGWATAVHPDDAEATIAAWNESVDKRKTFLFEHRVKMKDGFYQKFAVSAIPLLNQDGSIREWVGVHTDITEQKKAERELKNSFQKIKEDEERLNIIIDASELGTWELNLKTKEVKYSFRYLQIFGYTKMQEFTHAELLHHLHPDDLVEREKAFRHALETGYLQYEARLIWNDLSIHWMEGKGKVFYDNDKQPSILIGTIRDITDEKYFQQQLKDREQKFRLLADSMPQFVWTGDAEGSLNYFNQAVYDYSGLTAEEINKSGWLQIVHPDDQEENIKRWMQAITTGTDFLLEHRFRRSDGEYRWQLSRAIPQRDAAGNIQMWVGSSTDIQEMKELDQQKDFFISMASHELKTPITSIKGYVQMLQSMYSKKDDTFLKNSLRVIDKQIITLTNLISDLLDLSKIKSGSLFLSKEDFEINELTREIIDEIEHVNHDYSFVFSCETEKIVHADRERIGQVLRNFLTNAVKYSPESKTVKIKCESDAGEVTISVEDAGIGINKNDQEKIFERFYRVEGKNEKTFPGFGIGLFISAEIVHRHHGEIGVKSEPGKGSVFYFSLPLK